MTANLISTSVLALVVSTANYAWLYKHYPTPEKYVQVDIVDDGQEAKEAADLAGNGLYYMSGIRWMLTTPAQVTVIRAGEDIGAINDGAVEPRIPYRHEYITTVLINLFKQETKRHYKELDACARRHQPLYVIPRCGNIASMEIK